MLSCSRQVAQDMESRCYPGQSLIWTSASEKTHMTHSVCARKQFAMKSIKWRTQALRKSLFLHQYVVAWIENLRAGEGLTNGLPKQKWGENGRPWIKYHGGKTRHKSYFSLNKICLHWQKSEPNELFLLCIRKQKKVIFHGLLFFLSSM